MYAASAREMQSVPTRVAMQHGREAQDDASFHGNALDVMFCWIGVKRDHGSHVHRSIIYIYEPTSDSIEPYIPLLPCLLLLWQ